MNEYVIESVIIESFSQLFFLVRRCRLGSTERRRRTFDVAACSPATGVRPKRRRLGHPLSTARRLRDCWPLSGPWCRCQVVQVSPKWKKKISSRA